ncbi:MAG: glycosyltransferase [Propionicimonas sp.]|uniref:glycosyltransferase n=1 Tax=Propionicimonas sp. TaxID=1955623 RepID=UPI002B1F9602|nr:glycosyltransferase [Propionicimonas sp.]MEA4943401.1 glycosyltransferase [Propionicimonas sp.]MEA5051902.1 glycosyltransferase [Propionicimonas sp.]MEA5118604.1 glycosyltransferase [Propionicimonas sp.]
MGRRSEQEATIIDDPAQPATATSGDTTARPERVLTIAEFTDNYGPAHSGLLYALHFLEEQVLKAGHRLLLVAPVADGPNPFAGYPRRREIRLPSVQLPGTGMRISMGQDFDYRLAQLVANPPDVIHVHGLGAVGLLGMWVAQRTGKPLVVTWHTDFEAYADHYWHLVPFLTAAYRVYTMHLEGSTWNELKKLAAKRPRRGGAQVELLQVCANMLADAELVTTPSSKTAKRVLELAPNARVRVVPNGTDPLPVGATVPRARGPRLLYVGRISPEKGIELLLDAFALVRDAVPDAELMIVGQWESTPLGLRHKLGKAARFGGVKLVGEVAHDRLGSYYASADVFIFPSLTDTQALVLHEAAHAGLPIVLVDHELRLVVDPGVNAELGRPNPVSFAAATIRMLDELKDPSFAEAAAARSRELAAQWSVAAQSREFVDIYEAVADGRPVPLTEGLQPDYGRRIFPRRKVTATLEAPPSEVG